VLAQKNPRRFLKTHKKDVKFVFCRQQAPLVLTHTKENRAANPDHILTSFTVNACAPKHSESAQTFILQSFVRFTQGRNDTKKTIAVGLSGGELPIISIKNASLQSPED
jgi:hypothetical protein